MENKVKELVAFVDFLAKGQSFIEQNQLSYAEIEVLLQLVDVKKKGFLDLNDIYDLVGKVTEEELFTIFKFLDRERTGQVTLKQFQQALGNPSLASNNTQKEYLFPRFYGIIDTVKDHPKVLQKAKNQLSLTPNQLNATYEFICNLVQSKYLTNAEVVTVFKSQAMKYGLPWSEIHEKVICGLFQGQNVTQQKFTDCFSTKARQQVHEQQNLLTGIEFSRENTPKKESYSKAVSSNPLGKSVIQNRSEPVYQKKTNNFMELKTEVPGLRENNFMKVQERESGYRKEYDEIEGNINEVLGAIQQRRQKLRQDSLERKKMIEDVMNRKRQSCGYSQPKGMSAPKENSWNYRQQSEQAKSNYKSYLNVNQFTSSVKQQHPSQLPLKRESVTSDSFVQERQTYPFFKPVEYQPRQPTSPSFGLCQSKHNKSSTPLASSSANYDINEILKKYNNRSYPKEDDTSTLKELCKSKSGFIYSYQPQKYPKQQSELFEQSKWHPEREDMNMSLKYRGSTKENVLKRAEEQAARKIEQIERKARMKVLEKKSVLTRKEGREWRPLTKKGTYY